MAGSIIATIPMTHTSRIPHRERLPSQVSEPDESEPGSRIDTSIALHRFSCLGSALGDYLGQKPCAAFRLIDPNLDQAGSRYVSVLVTDLVCPAQEVC
jgi:hypothetical protein